MLDTLSSEELHALVLEHLLDYTVTKRTCGPSAYFIEGTKTTEWRGDGYSFSHFAFPDCVYVAAKVLVASEVARDA